jgi:lactoylglutathione lyase
MQYLHTMIRVSNLEDTLHFFCEILGMVEISRKSSMENTGTW